MVYTVNDWTEILEKPDCFAKVPKYSGSLLSYKEECYKVAEKYRQFDKVWIALSGGNDCVTIALLFKQLGITFETVTHACYFNENCYNLIDVMVAREFCQKYNIKHKIIKIDIDKLIPILIKKYSFATTHAFAILCYLAEQGYQPLVTGKGDIEGHTWKGKTCIYDLTSHWLSCKARDIGLEIYDFWNSTRELSLSGFRDSNSIGTKAYASLHDHPPRPPDVGSPLPQYVSPDFKDHSRGATISLVCEDFDTYINGGAVIFKTIDDKDEGFQDWVSSCNENQLDYIKQFSFYNKIKNKLNFTLDSNGKVHV